MTRVQIPAYTDAWMRGDRYGEITNIVTEPITRGGKKFVRTEIARVKLDKSGKTVRVILADCTILDPASYERIA